MKKLTKTTLLLSTILLSITSAYAQNVKVGNVTTGVTTTGNTLSINTGNSAVQIANVPPVVEGVMSAAQQMTQNSNATTSPAGDDKLAAATAQLAQKQQEVAEKANAIKLANENVKIVDPNQQNLDNQEKIRGGQDLSLLQPNIVTNNIAFYNKTTITQIETKAAIENPKMYEKFPEYMIKNY